MSTSPVSVANRALGLLGCSAINDFSDTNKKAELIRTSFNGLRDEVLEEVDWTFATTRARLVLSSTAPEWGFAAAYQLPANCVRVVELKYDPESDAEVVWRRELDKVLTEELYPQVYIRYISLIEDFTKWSSQAVKALIYACASEWAIPLTENRTLMDKYKDLYEDMMDSAGMTDGSQGSREQLRAKRIMNVR